MWMQAPRSLSGRVTLSEYGRHEAFWCTERPAGLGRGNWRAHQLGLGIIVGLDAWEAPGGQQVLEDQAAHVDAPAGGRVVQRPLHHLVVQRHGRVRPARSARSATLSIPGSEVLLHPTRNHMLTTYTTRLNPMSMPSVTPPRRLLRVNRLQQAFLAPLKHHCRMLGRAHFLSVACCTRGMAVSASCSALGGHGMCTDWRACIMLAASPTSCLRGDSSRTLSVCDRPANTRQ